MNRTEHLLSILAEECAEVAQRASKALRFGLTEVQPGQPFSNATRIEIEFYDLVAVYQMLLDNKSFAVTGLNGDECIRSKKEKVEKFLKYSEECGTLDGPEKRRTDG